MPLILIDVIRGRDEQQLQRLMDTIHDAMVEAFAVPESDRYQVVTQHEPHEITALDTGLGFTRTRDLVILRFVSRQRTDGAKQHLYRLLAARLERDCEVDPADLIVTVVENDAGDWSFGGGVAQFLTGAL